MVQHLDENNLLSNHQHGFITGKSCLTIITGAKNRGFSAILVMLDLAKAFDTGPHEELLCKLNIYGFDGFILDWLKSFLVR